MRLMLGCAALSALWLCGTSSAQTPRRHALLIGIGDYAEGVPKLEGPRQDVAAVRDVLVRSWQFPASQVTALVDSEATRDRILSSLDALAARVRRGDYVFLYFSGHGTSAWAPNSAAFGMESHTGALVPADLHPGPADVVIRQLILSTRDLRPRLTKLDATAVVFAAFDACYSGDSIKSVHTSHPGLAPRMADLVPRGGALRKSYLEQFESLSRQNGHSAVRDHPYPYRDLVYISAAAKSERAWDIPESILSAGMRETVDGKPHGVFTNALLLALNGQADLNRDGEINYSELHQYLVRNVQPDFGQYPQLLHAPENPERLSSPVFGVRGVPASTAAPRVPAKLRVRLENVTGEVPAKIAALANVELSNSSYDLLVRQTGSNLELRHCSGTPIRMYTPAQLPQLIARVQRQAGVLQLIHWRAAVPRFAVNLEILPADREIHHAAEKIEMRVRPEADSYLLLLNIDVDGVITVQYPLSPAQLSPAKAGQWIRAATGVVGPPFGTEVLKVLAFAEKPGQLDTFVKKQFPPEDPLFDRLMQMLLQHAAKTSEDTRLVFTLEGGKP
ncbi:MAG: caspase family protein [Acidobacteria bacterium]|nr:caspase family protein [Acidobacteriota bacterium]